MVTTAGEEERNWQVTLWSMVGIQFVMSLALTVIGPILPVFLPQIGVHERAEVEFWSGNLNSCGFLIAAFASPIWGRLGDRHGRKLMVLRSSAAICVFTALMGLSQNVWELFILRASMGAFSGFSSTAIALVASRVPERRLGLALGWLSTAQLMGGLIGPVVGGALADWTGSCRIAFYWTSVLAASALMIAWRIVPEGSAVVPGKHKKTMLAGYKMLVRTPGLLPLFLILLLAQFAVRAVLPVITIFVQSLVKSGTADVATLAGLAFAITALADLIASPFLGKRSDTIGYRKVLVICLFGAAVMTIPQIFVQHYWLFVVERFGVGIFIGGILPTANALVGRLSPPGDRGLVYGMTASATFLGGFFGPFTGGAVASLLGIRWVFGVTATVLFVNLIWVIFAISGPAVAALTQRQSLAIPRVIDGKQ
jgi:DHA1 family multidrug resistance protein-like MFS transporter